MASDNVASDNVDNIRKVSPEELAKHATAKDCWLLIDGIVYDVTKYLDNHPGGSAVMVEHAGQDCTSNFEDIGHSSTAHTVMKTLQVGAFDGPSKKSQEKKKVASTEGSSSSGGGGMGMGFIMFVAVALAVAGYMLMGRSS